MLAGARTENEYVRSSLSHQILFTIIRTRTTIVRHFLPASPNFTIRATSSSTFDICIQHTNLFLYFFA